jgi:hypothetical protein
VSTADEWPSIAHIADVLAECGWTVSARTLQRHFARLGLDHRPPTAYESAPPHIHNGPGPRHKGARASMCPETSPPTGSMSSE